MEQVVIVDNYTVLVASHDVYFKHSLFHSDNEHSKITNQQGDVIPENSEKTDKKKNGKYIVEIFLIAELI